MKKGWLAIVFLCLLLSACGIEVPADKQQYVGEWKGVGMTMVITSDGGFSYERIKGSGKTSINAPIQGFQGDNFTVGIGLFDTTFTVTVPPNNESGKWKMVVDGVELTRVR
jgi:hypothetical protein